MSAVAVLILNYNGASDTIACVRSVQASRRPADWIIVVDNASPDGSEAVIRSACPGVTLLQSGANLGFAGGNNVGVRWALAAGADFVWLLNSDAVAGPGALGALIAEAEADAGLGAVGTRIYFQREPTRLQCWGGGWANPLLGRSQEFDHRVPLAHIDYVSGCSLLLRRAAIVACGSLDEGFFMYFEDTELGFRYRRAGWRLGVADAAEVWHKGGASVGSNPRQSAWRTQSLLRFQKLHGPSYPLSLAASTVLRGASFTVRRDWTAVRELIENVRRFAASPDWRSSP